MQENRKSAPWTVANAKAHLSEVIERAQSEPQMITRNGTPSVVMVSVEEWNRKSARKGSLASFLMSSPLAGSGLDDERLDDAPRPVVL
ncbi:MAG: type II toxin-antitoxin system Phd/YefM family antitoxin [Candidatus Devosia phytovorans]|uniref:Antitoxin n=1 Tax=Candidatus Devosia phytovorans TaxID=3121372 RepID=A0AAJ6B203_9HYPH|nr:type II toxin-antitoxin system Phd/YefM family antitoxin [Devosia sp.]WEK06862.1 MAG: type II toxin-antitoxin system Phd/YefM family antitoxin [Devosia sp.]